MTDRLHAFARAVATRRASTEVLDASVMDEIAKDLGMTDDEILAARAEGQARKERAKGLRQRGLLDDAITELDEAVAWSPHDVEVLTLLADTYVRRGRKNNDATDLDKGRALALEVLRIAPADTEAPAILQTIKMNPPQQNTSMSYGIVAVVAAVVVAAIAALVAFL